MRRVRSLAVPPPPSGSCVRGVERGGVVRAVRLFLLHVALLLPVLALAASAPAHSPSPSPSPSPPSVRSPPSPVVAAASISASDLTLFGSAAPPLGVVANDRDAYDLGTRFSSAVDGAVTGARFYKDASNVGTYSASLWDPAVSTSTPLATVVFANESSSGWQQAAFATPVSIVAGRSYVIAYTKPQGGLYAFAPNLFTNANVTSGPLTALRSTPQAKNGLFKTGATGPSRTRLPTMRAISPTSPSHRPTSEPT